MCRLWRLTWLASAGLLATSLLAGTKIQIDPGPATISAAERAIEADPAAGAEHAVVLVHETQLDDAYGTNSETQHHLRAKILSNEARDLANVEIFLDPDEKLTRWWGMVLLPDGGVLRVEERELAEQSLVRVGRRETRALKAALPGVVPGAVIDYGYTVKSESIYSWRRIALERTWPTRSFRYRWRPSGGYVSAYRVYRTEGLDVSVKQDRDSVLITGNDLPAVRAERYMPPDYETRGSVILYYMIGADNYKDYWNEQARLIDRQSRSSKAGPLVTTAIGSIGTEQQPDLWARLEAAYTWVAEQVENPLVRYEGGARHAAPPTSGVSGPQDQIFIDLARALGAEADVVLAPDRRESLWDPHLKTMRQLEIPLVAVRAPGDPDDRTVVVDPSSGLPFGHVPWWTTGVEGMLATSDGARPIGIATSKPSANMRMTQGSLRLTDDFMALRATWTTEARGQSGSKIAHMGQLSRSEREKYCGGGPERTVARAEFTVLPGLTVRIECELEIPLGATGETIGQYMAGWDGPWVGTLPTLPPGTRAHPVVFDFPEVEITEIEFHPPEGFATMEPPEAIGAEGSYGKYRLEIAATADGYKIQRALARFPVAIPASEYDELREFFETIHQADAVPVGFRRVESEP